MKDAAEIFNAVSVIRIHSLNLCAHSWKIKTLMSIVSTCKMTRVGIRSSIDYTRGIFEKKVRQKVGKDKSYNGYLFYTYKNTNL